MEPARDTIAALATPSGPAQRGVIRVSGPKASELVHATLRGTRAFSPAEARRLLLGTFDDGRGEQPVMVLWMRAPRSFTREDVAEFHLPGSPPLLACALGRLLALGARAARPGEFTRRAFLNGRLDLSRVEGILALTEAATAEEHRAAVLLLSGGLDARLATLREALLDVLTLTEASLDFDETETGHVPVGELRAALAQAASALETARGFEAARLPASGLPRVVLVGAPNAGNSALFNALTRGRALVSPLPGTTRDALSGRWELEGGACLLIDGPGLESGAEPAARKAQALFELARRSADLVLWVVDGSAAMEAEPPERAALLVLTKADLEARAGGPRASTLPRVSVSALRSTGLEELRERVGRLLFLHSGPEGHSSAVLLGARNLEALAQVEQGLGEAFSLLEGGFGLDLLAEAVRGALRALDELSGRATPEHVLDRIFARFCLGKLRSAHPTDGVHKRFPTVDTQSIAWSSAPSASPGRRSPPASITP